MENTCRFLLAVVIWTSCHAATSNVPPGSTTLSEAEIESEYLQLILDKLTSLEQRLTSHDQRFTALQSQIANGFETQTCGNVPKTTGDEEIGSVTENEGQTVEQTVEQLSFKIRRASKEDADNGFEVKLEYEGITEPKVYVTSHMSGRIPEPLENYGTISHERQTVELSLEGEYPEGLFVIFIVGDDMYVVELILQKGGSTQEDVPFPNVVFSPGRDVTYSSDGNDAEVELTVTFSDVERLSVSKFNHFHWTAYTKSETKETVAVKYRRSEVSAATAPGPVLDVQQLTSDNGRYSYQLLVNTTYKNTDTVFHASHSFHLNFTGGCLVSAVYFMAELRYYQAGRSGPFPAGYLGFVDGVSRDNTAFRYCSTSHTSCQIACEVIGQDVTDLSLRRVNADENSAALEAHTTFAFGSWRAEVANIDDVSFSDAGQYECLARTQDQSVITSRILVLESQELQYLELILDKLTSLDQRITTLDQRITSLGQRLTSHDQRFTALQIQIADDVIHAEADRSAPEMTKLVLKLMKRIEPHHVLKLKTEMGRRHVLRVKPEMERHHVLKPKPEMERRHVLRLKPEIKRRHVLKLKPEKERRHVLKLKPEIERHLVLKMKPEIERHHVLKLKTEIKPHHVLKLKPEIKPHHVLKRKPEIKRHHVLKLKPEMERHVLKLKTEMERHHLPFKLRRVTKEDTDDGVEVKVEYAGFTEPTVYLRYGDSRFPEPLENHETISHENRTIEFSLNDDEVDSVVYVLFAAGDRWFVLVLLLEKGHPTQEDVSFPRVVITPGRDVTYSSDGNDAEVDLVVTFDDIKRVPTRQSLHWTAYVNSETKQHTAVRYQENGDYGVASPGPVLEVEQVSAEEGRYSYRLLVNTTYQETDALFEIHGSFYFGCYENCLVKSMHVTTGFSVHHADRQVPFPAGYVAFLEDVSKDNTIQYCNIRPEERGPCEIVCEVVGQDITDLQLDKVEQDPGTTWNNGRRMNVTYGFWRAEVLRLDDVSLSDAGQYLCIARTKGLEVNRTVSLEIAAFAKIDANRSKIRILENGSIEALCVAEGYPPPDVTFDDKYTSLGEVPDSEYSVQVTRSGNTTEAVLAVPDPSWASRIYSLRFVFTTSCFVAADISNAIEDGITLTDNERSMELRYLEVIVDKLTSLDQRMTSLDQSITSLDQRMTTLDQRLTSQDQRFTSIQDQIGDTCRKPETTAAVTDETGETTDQTTEKPQEQDSFRIRRITKEDTDIGYKVKVEYEGLVKPEIFLWNHEPGAMVYEPLGNHGVLDHANHFLELSLKSNVSDPSIIFITRDIGYQLSLRLRPAYVASKKDPHKVLRYHQFESHDLNATFLRAELLSKEEGRRYTFKLLLNTTKGHDDGVFDLSLYFRFNCSHDCLVEELVVFTDLKTYQEDHEGPFPEGFVGFVDNSGEGKTTVSCGDGDPCELECQVISEHLTDLQFFRVGQGEWTSAARVWSFSGFAHVGRAKLISFPQTSFSDAGQYQCTARTPTAVVSKTLTLVVVKFAQIDREQSNVTVLEDGSLRARCVAEGYPPPDVTFDDDEYSSLGEVPDSEYSVQVTRSGNTTEAVLTVPDPSWASRLDIVFTTSCFVAADISNAIEDGITLADNGRSMELRYLEVIVAKLTSLDMRLTSLDQRITSLDQSVTSLDQRMTSLDQRLTSQDQRFVSLQDQLGVTCRKPEATDTVTGKTGETTDHTTTTPQEQEDTGYGFNVKVEYEGLVKPDILLIMDDLTTTRFEPLENYGVLDHANHFLELSLKSNVSDPLIFFITRDIGYQLSLRLRPGGANREELPSPTVVFTPGRDVTYPDGNDAEVTLTVTFDDVSDKELYYKDLFWIAYYTSEKDPHKVVQYNQFTSRYLNATLLQAELLSKVEGRRYTFKLLLNTTKGHNDAVFNVFVGFKLNCSSDCLVRDLDVFTAINAYHEDHHGPFPEGFVGFADIFEEGKTTVHCFVDEPCQLYCNVISEHLTDLQFFRVGQGEWTSTAEAWSVSDFTHPGQMEIISFPQTSFSDAGQYQCTARTPSAVVSKTFTLVIVKFAQIDREQSNVTVLEDGELDYLEVIVDKLTSLDMRFTSLDQRITALDQNITSLDQRMTSLDQGITSLDQRMTSMDQRFTSLQNQIGDTCRKPEATDTVTGETGETTDQTTTKPQEQVKVEYEGLTKPEIYLLLGDGNTPVHQPLGNHGVLDHANRFLELWLHETNYSAPMIHFVVGDTEYKLTLRLRRGDAIQEELPTPRLVLSPGHEVQYVDGNDAE
ncbi:hypothetical protein BaRGS_00010844, partial [Batillaria attramentaria]